MSYLQALKPCRHWLYKTNWLIQIENKNLHIDDEYVRPTPIHIKTFNCHYHRHYNIFLSHAPQERVRQQSNTPCRAKATAKSSISSEQTKKKMQMVYQIKYETVET